MWSARNSVASVGARVSEQLNHARTFHGVLVAPIGLAFAVSLAKISVISMLVAAPGPSEVLTYAGRLPLRIQRSIQIQTSRGGRTLSLWRIGTRVRTHVRAILRGPRRC